jgi:predicted metalloprotease with PDZ domain
MRFLALLLLLTAPAVRAATAVYNISLHDRAAEVTARFPVAPVPAVTFKLHSWAGFDYFQDIERVTASDLRGNPLPVEAKPDGEWIVQNRRRPFTLTWRVQSAKNAMIEKSSGSQFHATLLKDWALLWGHAFILLPEASPLVQAPVRVRIETHEYGASDSTLPRGGKLAHLADLSDQLFLAGAFRVYRRPGRRFYFATSQAVVPDRDLMQAVDRIFLAQTRYMGVTPLKSPFFVFTDGLAWTTGGTVVRNSAVFYPDLSRDLQSENRGALRLIGHEIFHLWNGSRMRHRADAAWSDGKYGWFMEGFTEYYSGATLFREGILDAPGFAAFLNSLIRDYAQNGESLRATLDEMGSQHWRDRDHDRLPHTKGALLGLLMDVQLRARGRKLDDYMRVMLRSPEYGLPELRAAWSRLAGESALPFWNRFVIGAEALPFAEVLRAADVKFEETSTPIFELGFTIDKPNLEKGAKVLAVVPGSSAEEAGIRPGDSLQGISVYNGDPTKPAKFSLLRNTERVSVTYLPATTRVLVQLGTDLTLLR